MIKIKEDYRSKGVNKMDSNFVIYYIYIYILLYWITLLVLIVLILIIIDYS